MQPQYKTHAASHRVTSGIQWSGGPEADSPAQWPSIGEGTQAVKRGAVLLLLLPTLIWSGNLRRGKLRPPVLISHAVARNCRDFNSPSISAQNMDFILPAGGIPWEKVLPPRLNGTYGHYNWSPKLLIPETDNSSSAEVGPSRMSFVTHNMNENS